MQRKASVHERMNEENMLPDVCNRAFDVHRTLMQPKEHVKIQNATQVEIGTPTAAEKLIGAGGENRVV